MKMAIFLVGRGTVGFWQPLDRILALTQVHDGDTRDLSYPALQVTIAGGDDITLVLHHTLHQAVIGVGSLVRAWQTFETGVACYPQSHLELGAQLLQLGHDTVRDTGDRFGVETVHHALDQLDFVLDREVDEVGIHQDPVWRSKSRVVVEEHGRSDLGTIWFQKEKRREREKC